MKLPGFMQFTPHERKAILALLLFTGGGGLLIEAGRRFPVYFSGLIPAAGDEREEKHEDPDSAGVRERPVASSEPADSNSAATSAAGEAVGRPEGGSDPHVTRSGLSGGTTEPRRRAAASPEPSLPIDINSADENSLTRLPGIGPRLAARVVADRIANGPFRSVDDLARVKGIGPATVARVRTMVTIG